MKKGTVKSSTVSLYREFISRFCKKRGVFLSIVAFFFSIVMRFYICPIAPCFFKNQPLRRIKRCLIRKKPKKTLIPWGNFVTKVFRDTPNFVTKLPHPRQTNVLCLYRCNKLINRMYNFKNVRQ